MTTTPKEGEAGKHAALDALRAALLAGDVVPGQRLVEAELAETFGVTRASMRAALIDLTAEGLVERIPHRGARVRVVSVEEAVAITECRMVLEGLCAAKAAEKVTDDEIDSLRELAGRLRSAVDDGDSTKYSELNRELHRTVREIAGQSVAAELLERLHGQIVRHQFRLAMRAGRPHVSLPEHLAIIDTIARRDPDAAEQAARAHLRSVITALRETDN
ncbi:GntR family transcriptional regulator [Amycolatopsis carbonis]|uniref:GntR family transcriptional regulator n=1 Tax=Amycolatopsis carbonis TaxID=715471 RepID=A0A9Y2IBH6_9PSEU|nr:GntR family transcriptional regulator [Amycolatopsis sp. 2-15]WIX76489.1 GntR family transcriptional regulator [Amycolatopsis sp. 2-15]